MSSVAAEYYRRYNGPELLKKHSPPHCDDRWIIELDKYMQCGPTELIYGRYPA